MLRQFNREFIETLFHAGLRKIAHLANAPTVFGDRELGLVASSFESQRTRYFAREIVRHSHRARVNAFAVFVRQILSEFNKLHRNDFLVDAAGVKILATLEVLWRAHVKHEVAAFSKINFASRRGETRRTPPTHHEVGIGPGVPNLFDGSFQRHSYYHVLLS